MAMQQSASFLPRRKMKMKAAAGARTALLVYSARPFVLAADGARVLRSRCPSSNSERARGMPGAGLAHGPPAKKMQAAGTTGSAENVRHPPRDGFNAYTWSPRCTGLFGHRV